MSETVNLGATCESATMTSWPSASGWRLRVGSFKFPSCLAPAPTNHDFNGDGKPDLVWQDDATRQVGVWYMGGAGGNVVLGWSWLAPIGVPGWRAIAR